MITHSSAVRDSPTVEVKGYSTDTGFWAAWPDMTGWPHVLWNIAATVASMKLVTSTASKANW